MTASAWSWVYFTPRVRDTKIELGVAVALFRRQASPGDRFGMVLRNAFAPGVRDAEVELRRGLALIRRQAIPPGGFRVVLRYAQTAVIRVAEVDLRTCVALFSRFSKPFAGFGIVLRHAQSVRVERGKTELRQDITLVRGFPEPFDGFHIILRDTLSPRRHVAEVKFCDGIALIRRFTKPLDGLRMILGSALAFGVAKPRLACASTRPWSAARRNHLTASASSRDTPRPLVYHHAEIELRGSIAPIRRLPIPFDRLGVIQSHAAPISLRKPGRIARPRCLARPQGDTTSPLPCSLVRHPCRSVRQPETELRLAVALFGGAPKPLHVFRRVGFFLIPGCET